MSDEIAKLDATVQAAGRQHRYVFRISGLRAKPSSILTVS